MLGSALVRALSIIEQHSDAAFASDMTKTTETTRSLQLMCLSVSQQAHFIFNFRLQVLNGRTLKARCTHVSA
eukprot:5717233-Amphidinium_carterae.5